MHPAEEDIATERQVRLMILHLFLSDWRRMWFCKQNVPFVRCCGVRDISISRTELYTQLFLSFDLLI